MIAASGHRAHNSFDMMMELPLLAMEEIGLHAQPVADPAIHSLTLVEGVSDLGLEKEFNSSGLHSVFPTISLARSKASIAEGSQWSIAHPVASIDIASCCLPSGARFAAHGIRPVLSKPLVLLEARQVLLGVQTLHPAGYAVGNSLVLAPFSGGAEGDITRVQAANLDVPQPVADIKLINATTAVAAIGGAVRLVRLPTSSSDVSSSFSVGETLMSSPSDIRELAVSPATGAVGFGGFTSHVHLLQLGEGHQRVAASAVQSGGVVSSVRWSPIEPAILSWTTERGILSFWDVRVPPTHMDLPAGSWIIQSRVPWLSWRNRCRCSWHR